MTKRVSAKDCSGVLILTLRVVTQPSFHIILKIREQPLQSRKLVRKLARSVMAMIALAGLIIVTQHACAGGNERQAIFEMVPRP